jgi:hypothetical protein
LGSTYVFNQAQRVLRQGNAGNEQNLRLIISYFAAIMRILKWRPVCTGAFLRLPLCP